MICTARTDPTTEVAAWVGQPCSDCGHTMLVHGGPANPDLVECVTCAQVAAVAELRGARDVLANRIAQLASWRTTATTALTNVSERVAVLELHDADHAERLAALEAQP